MIRLTKITRKYQDRTADIKARTTARLADEIAEERISRKLTEERNARVRERRETPHWLR